MLASAVGVLAVELSDVVGAVAGFFVSVLFPVVDVEFDVLVLFDGLLYPPVVGDVVPVVLPVELDETLVSAPEVSVVLSFESDV